MVSLCPVCRHLLQKPQLCNPEFERAARRLILTVLPTPILPLSRGMMERGGGATEKESFFHLLPFLVAFLKLHAYATQQQNESDGLGDGGGGGRKRLTTLVVRRLNLVALLTFLSNFLPFSHGARQAAAIGRALPLPHPSPNERPTAPRKTDRTERGKKSEDEPLAQMAAGRRRPPVVFPRNGDGTPDGFDGGEGKGERSLSAGRTLTYLSCSRQAERSGRQVAVLKGKVSISSFTPNAHRRESNERTLRRILMTQTHEVSSKTASILFCLDPGTSIPISHAQRTINKFVFPPSRCGTTSSTSSWATNPPPRPRPPAPPRPWQRWPGCRPRQPASSQSATLPRPRSPPAPPTRGRRSRRHPPPTRRRRRPRCNKLRRPLRAATTPTTTTAPPTTAPPISRLSKSLPEHSSNSTSTTSITPSINTSIAQRSSNSTKSTTITTLATPRSSSSNPPLT